MRRSVGVGRALKARKERAAFQEVGAALSEAKLEDMQVRLKEFKENLEAFATKHAGKINKDPEFRSKFQSMCAKVGVDPLSSSKGFWAEVLGVGSFFYELGVQILHVCLATRETNGGIMKLSELTSYLKRLRAKSVAAKNDEKEVTEDDVKRAIGTLQPLGNGVKLVQVGHIKMLISVPMELSSDHTTLLSTAQAAGGVVSVQDLEEKLQWKPERAEQALQALQTQGMAWVDNHEGKQSFWFPSLRLSLVH